MQNEYAPPREWCVLRRLSSGFTATMGWYWFSTAICHSKLNGSAKEHPISTQSQQYFSWADPPIKSWQTQWKVLCITTVLVQMNHGNVNIPPHFSLLLKTLVHSPYPFLNRYSLPFLAYHTSIPPMNATLAPQPYVHLHMHTWTASFSCSRYCHITQIW